MPDYVPKALSKFSHVPPHHPQHLPHPWTSLVYGQRVYHATTKDSMLLPANRTQCVQAIAGTFLYYARAVIPTILAALNEISNKQSAPTTLTETACNQLLDYLHMHPDPTLHYYASDMVLCLVSDAAYLVLPNAYSHCAMLFTLTNHPTGHSPNPHPNGQLHVMVKTMKGVLTLASEAKTSSVSLAAKKPAPS
jgi:hypothetical protein